MSLLFQTGNARVDRILQGFLSLSELLLPDRIRACYLTGSYTDGSAVISSDIDIEMVLKGDASDAERDQIYALAKNLNLISPVQLDLTPVSEEELITLTGEGPYSSISILVGGVLLYGEDTRPTLKLPPLFKFIRETMHSVPGIFGRTRDNPATLPFPLSLPDPDGAFYGYDKRLMRDSEGNQRPGLKDMVVGACWAASAILALQAGRYSCKKHQTVQLYGELIGGEWANFLHQIDTRCRMAWQYFPPDSPDERSELRHICARMCDFETHFLALYRDFCLKELRELPVTEDEWRVKAVEGLGFVHYPDAEVRTMLDSLTRDASPTVQAAAETARRTYS